jgi:hypothetical protein
MARPVCMQGKWGPEDTFLHPTTLFNPNREHRVGGIGLTACAKKLKLEIFPSATPFFLLLFLIPLTLTFLGLLLLQVLSAEDTGIGTCVC